MNDPVYVWTIVRAEIADNFGGQLPRADDEQAIIDMFETMPQTVIRVASEVASQVQSGKVTWGWSALKARLERGANASRNIIVQGGNRGREQRVAIAEQWMRAAGLHFPNTSEVLDELFDTQQSILADFATDQPLRERMTNLYEELQPTVQAMETEQTEIDQAWIGSASGLRWSNHPDAGKVYLEQVERRKRERAKVAIPAIDPHDIPF